MDNDGAKAIIIAVLAIPIDIVVDIMWGQLNSGTNYTNWSLAAELIYQHLIPIPVSGGISAVIVNWADDNL